MAHTRIRPFNTKVTYPEQNLDNDLCQAVVAGNMVFLRGQIGQDLDTRESVGKGDVAAQTEQAMYNIKMLLEESRAASWKTSAKSPCTSPMCAIARRFTTSWVAG